MGTKHHKQGLLGPLGFVLLGKKADSDGQQSSRRKIMRATCGQAAASRQYPQPHALTLLRRCNDHHQAMSWNQLFQSYSITFVEPKKP